jgi:septum site-determining protein MinC
MDMSVPQFELKAGTFTLPLLRLLGTDMAAMAQQLADKVEQAGHFFYHAPIVIDLKEISTANVDFPMLLSLMRGHNMIPVGVRGGTASQHDAAEAAELAVLADSRPQRSENKPAIAASPTLSPPVTKPATITTFTTLVTKPIRSGQRVYAQDGDLVVLGQVSSGAEIMADGNIHVYSVLRGRALAGLKGNSEARIFCLDLRAELISVAGHYRISENIDPQLGGRPVQIYLEERVLRIDPL